MNVEKIRKDFPIFEKKKFIYFDNACMPLRPKVVIDKINEYYTEYPACAGRSYHDFGTRLTDEVANARDLVKKFIGAKKAKEIIFTKNATESINLVANSFKFNSVLTSDREHNSNLLPWQKFDHDVVKSKKDFSFDLESFSDKVKNFDIVSMVHTSNLEGYSLPVKEIIKIAHEQGAKVLLDGAQSVPHKEINVRKLDVDFLAFSGHKMLGPNGVGVLYGKEELLDGMKPFILGGETVSDSTYDSYKLEELPHKFEAGLQNYPGILGLGSAAKYLMKIGRNNIEKHENMLKSKIDIEGVEKIGHVGESGIFNFNIPGKGAHEVAMMLSASKNIMIRSGAHCMHSWFNSRNLEGSARASFYLYNTLEEIDTFVEELEKIKKL
ncbi:cysteine desulfurase [archaeon]|nr:cysteine desulfurase [archaeon]MBT6824253.1 cysteine desulfurase [archaeon]MBT7106819.1 cysteine desulfurase [archaeon]MBT7297510.1 cysteine desulfurase [archaeon]